MKSRFLAVPLILFYFTEAHDAFASPHYRRMSSSGGSRSSSALITYRPPRQSRSSARASLRSTSTNPQDYIVHESTASHQFMTQTGYPNGRPGYVIVYVVSLKDGGADAPSNMRWRKEQSLHQASGSNRETPQATSSHGF
ncbi:MAG: hypothetical protein U0136_13830 [Bdellovibrionota bacterium]